MSNILLVAILLTNTAVLVAILVAFIKIREVYLDFVEFITTPDKDTPSPFAQMASAMAADMARALVAQVKTTFMGKQSGEARAQAAVEGELAEAALSAANPLIGGLVSSFPVARKMLRKHPELIDWAIQKFGNQSTSIPANPGSTQGEQVKFTL